MRVRSSEHARMEEVVPDLFQSPLHHFPAFHLSHLHTGKVPLSNQETGVYAV